MLRLNRALSGRSTLDQRVVWLSPSLPRRTGPRHHLKLLLKAERRPCRPNRR